MSYYYDNIEIFKDTRELSRGRFVEKTAKAIKGTSVKADLFKNIDSLPEVNQKVKVISSGTIQAAINNHRGRTAILNFADALEPGGMVLQGENTQEECICRCSNLYECLISGVVYSEYYQYNASLNNGGIASNRIIYSEDVTIFKDEDYNLLDEPFKVDVITCPAPIMCRDIDIWVERIECILVSAVMRNCNTIILGAFGCGAFGNSPHLVADCFKKVLQKYSIIEDVIFAIRPTSTDDKLNNYEIFLEYLG